MLRELFVPILSPDRIIEGEAAQPYEAVTTGYQPKISGVLKPQNDQEIAQIITICRSHHIKLYPISTGRNWGYSDSLPATDHNVVLDLSMMKKISAYDAETGTVTIEPGVTQFQLHEFLKLRGGRHVVSITGSSPEASIIGNYLERGFGLLPIMDHASAVMSLTAILGDGTKYISPFESYGGHRSAKSFKWGMGPYTDGLFFQSSIGIVTQMTIKLAYQTDHIGVCIVEISDSDMLNKSMEQMRKLRENWPLESLQIKLLNHYYSFASMGVKQQDIIAAGSVEQACLKYDVAPYTLMITFSGHPALNKALQKYLKKSFRFSRRTVLINKRIVNVAQKVKSFLPQAWKIKVEILEGLWNLMQGVPSSMMIGRIPYYKIKDDAHLSKINPAADKCGIIWFALVLPFQKEGIDFFEKMGGIAKSEYGFDPILNFTNYSQAGMIGLFAIVFNQPDETDRAQKCYMDLLKRSQDQGYLTYRMPLFASEQFFKNSSGHNLNERIHDLLDPDRIFNRRI